MSDSTTLLDLISESQAQKEVTANALFDASSPAATLGRRASTTAALSWGYYGGVVTLDDGSLLQIGNGVKTLTDDATNYIELDTSDGTVDVNNSAWTGSAKKRLYKVITADGVVTSYEDWRTGSFAASGDITVGVSEGDKGDIVVTSDGDVWTIDNDAVTYAKMQNVSATNTLLGRSTAGAGNVEEIACTAAGRALLDDADAAAQRTTLGLGTAATLVFDTDDTLAADSDTRLPTQQAVKAYVDAAVAGGGGGGDALTSGTLAQFAPTTSAELRSVLSDETGTGAAVFANSPTLVTPALGTPSAVVLTNATGLPLTTGVTGVLPIANMATGTPDGTKFVRDDGTLAVPAGGGGGTPGGADTQIQYNDGGAFGGDADLTWNKTTNVMTVGSFATPGTIQGPTSTGTDVGAPLTIKAGAGATGSTGKGGNLLVIGGASNNVSGDGGNATLQGGASGSGTGVGGLVNITGGVGTNGVGGSVNIQAGTTASFANGAAVNITGGSAGTASTAGGTVTIKGGPGNSGGAGGPVIVQGGNAGATGNGGDASLLAGTVTAGNGGDVAITASSGVGTNKSGGNVTVRPGAATGTGTPGNIRLDGGRGAALATTATGGFVTIPTCAGTPTGTPVNVPTGSVPMIYDTVGLKLWTYTGGAWASSTAGPTQGKNLIAVNAGAMRPQVLDGCQILTVTQGATNQPDFLTLNFDAAVAEAAHFSIAMPKKWNLGTITARFRWSHSITSTNFGVVWSIQAVAVGDGDTVAVAFGTLQSVTDTGGTTGDLYITAETSAVTIAGTPAIGDTVFFRVFRSALDAADTLAIDARLHGVDIFITTNAENDA